MRLKIIIIINILLLGTGMLTAQNKHFTTEGVIEFEKTVNMFAIIKKQINKDNEAFLQPYYDKYIKEKPQFRKLKSTLTFANGQTLFTPIEDTENEGSFGDNSMVDQNNIIFTNFLTDISIAQKKVVDATFLVKDSIQRIRWKITDERRDIAGYSCRRANALVLDSVYVVAFYTDEIPVSGGPESFSGLPGMILGVAIPHENITWFATKVTDQTLPPNALKPPIKGKPVNRKQFKDTLLGILKDSGEYGRRFLKAFML